METCDGASGVCGIGGGKAPKLSSSKAANDGNRIILDVYSDPACPWCYVGKTNLDTAIENLRSSGEDVADRVVVNWRCFFIDPQTDPNGEDYLAYNRRRWGSDGWARSLPGRQEGRKFVNWKTWPNTLLSSRLIHLAGLRGGWELKHRAKGVIFRMIYEDGLNVSNLSVVEAAGRELGLEGVGEYLRSTEGQQDVIQEAKEGSRMGIGGVPFFICSREGCIDEPITFSGAQPPKTFIQTIRQLDRS